jgi:predicted PurR-regulated permease PerM
MKNHEKITSHFDFNNIVDIVIRLGILFLLIGWCLDILKPFILILIWGAVIAVAINPLHKLFVKVFRGSKVWGTIVMVLIMMSILLIPSYFISHSLYEGLHKAKAMYQSGEHLIPPPGDRVANWPGFTKPLVDFWQLASENLQAAMLKYSDQLKDIGLWLLHAFAGFGKGVLQFVVSILVAGVFLIYSDSLTTALKKIFKKLAGDSQENFIAISSSIIQNVVKGILGVAAIQAAMAGLGFFIAGVPFAGLWTILCLFLAIIQLGIGPIAIPIAIYMFSVTDTLTATLLAVWLVITLISDNILKPILLGRGAPAPMLVVFLGSIGGFIYNGFLGLFLGAVILTIGYKLVIAWMNSEEQEIGE